MIDLFIRRYIPSDKEKVKKLYEIASVHSEIGYRTGPWENDFENIEGSYFNGGEFLVGVLGDEIIALGGYIRISDKVGQVRRMRTHPNHRRNGFAKQLLRGLEERAKENGIEELRLKTSTQQKMAQNFYEKNGYEIKRMIRKEFYTEGPFEVVWYRKQLK